MKVQPEDPVRLARSLKSLGMTKYEALVYIALLQVPGATASEIHAGSSVPRASVYPVLDQLLAKDLVSVSQSSPKRFAAIPPDEAIPRLLGRIERDAEAAKTALESVYRRRESAEQERGELIWNIYGFDAIRRKLIDLIAGAAQEVRFIAHPNILAGEVRDMLMARSDRITVEVVTSAWDGRVPETMNIYAKPFPELPRGLYRTRDLMAGGICIIDGRKILVIVGSGTPDAVALFSESEGFVRFFFRYYSLITDWAKRSR